MTSVHPETIETLLENQSTTIAKDLKLNLTKFLEGASLSRDESHLALLAAATALEAERLAVYAADQLKALGLRPDEILEARESAAIVGMLNTYYRFRHFVGAPEEYRAAGLRMTALARPVLGKERFEMLAFTISVLNGCEVCTQAHEKALKEAGVPADKIHDLARLAAVVKGLSVLIKTERR
jgi:alkyl hydroperoxide reductase subunit D